MSDLALELHAQAFELLFNGDKVNGEKMNKAADEIARLTSALAASEEARRAERAAVVRECAAEVDETHTECSFFADEHGKQICERIAANVEALATDADNAALDKLIQEAERRGQIKAGGVFSDTDPQTQWIEDTENACSVCGGSGHKDDAAPALDKLLREARKDGMEKAAQHLHWMWNADGTKTERRVAEESAASIRRLAALEAPQ